MPSIKLTPRGKEVFSMILNGTSNKCIAKHLGMSLSGVRRHREKMLLQNDCENTLELLAKYYGSHVKANSTE
ncbi:LuxR C-terminal-related transcriptional regulator [Desulfovibrio sp.]|uniref:helix-turn-helix transcriptional regulator n=1 Tax=Desulfovibrio sp. TaxID=885 RepID=UPI0025C592F4|nr:LuxR C-terminal-related transcriptional regulator [Desulfovibrio sp.]